MMANAFHFALNVQYYFVFSAWVPGAVECRIGQIHLLAGLGLDRIRGFSGFTGGRTFSNNRHCKFVTEF